MATETSAGGTPGALPTHSSIPKSFHSHPSYRPSPVPHLVLPVPFDAYCLTPWTAADAVDLHRLAVHPDIAPYLGPKDAQDPKYDSIMAWNLGWLGRKDPEVVFQVIRETALVSKWSQSEAESTRPPVVGTLGIGSLDYGVLPSASRAAFKAADQAAPPSHKYYQTNMIVLDPAHGARARGLYTAAFAHLLHAWYLPMAPPPARLVSGWDANNVRSRRLHERLGFEVVGRHPGHGGEVPTVMAVWKGAGEIKKEESVLAHCPPVDYEGY